MDGLIELLGKYNCHLKRENQSMADFLKKDFDNYISDLEQAADYEKNPLTTNVMCDLVNKHISEVKEYAYKIVQVFNLYTEGKIIAASSMAFNVFDSMKSMLMLRYSGDFHKTCYFRIRCDESNQIPLVRKELFHIPSLMNYLVGTERYSMPGHPCLYLSSQAQLAWYECDQPERFILAKFDIPQDGDNCFKVIDFSNKLYGLMYSFNSWFQNEEDKSIVRKYLLKHLCTYPLRAACSVVVEHPKTKFIEEYILSQLLLQWVVNDTDIDGISYESCKDSDYVKSLGGHNIVLATKSFDKEGYDTRLREYITVGEPQYFDIKNYDKNNPFGFGMDSISSDYKQI